MHHWIGEVEGHAGAWGRVHGGMGAVSWCLAEAARAASPVVSSAHPKTTYLDLVGEEHLPPEVVRDIAGTGPGRAR